MQVEKEYLDYMRGLVDGPGRVFRDYRGYIVKEINYNFHIIPSWYVKFCRIQALMFLMRAYNFSKTKRMLRSVPHHDLLPCFVQPSKKFLFRCLYDPKAKVYGFCQDIIEFAHEYKSEKSCGNCFYKPRRADSFFCSESCLIGWRLKETGKKVDMVLLEGPTSREELTLLMGTHQLSVKPKNFLMKKRLPDYPANRLEEIRRAMTKRWETKNIAKRCLEIAKTSKNPYNARMALNWIRRNIIIKKDNNI